MRGKERREGELDGSRELEAQERQVVRRGNRLKRLKRKGVRGGREGQKKRGGETRRTLDASRVGEMKGESRSTGGSNRWEEGFGVYWAGHRSKPSAREGKKELVVSRF